jgi:hypothetical protein
VTIGGATFDYSGALATYTIPTTASYDIVVYGAQGGGTSGGYGGYGAEIGGDFTLLAGTVLGIVVGGAGGSALDHGGGGGGGSFVWIVSAPVVPSPPPRYDACAYTPLRPSPGPCFRWPYSTCDGTSR